jgi:hypothetical protein
VEEDGKTQQAQWNIFPLDIYGCPYDNRIVNHSRWTSDEENMHKDNSAETIWVFHFLQRDFIHNNDNVVTFYDTARTVEDTRGELSIQKSNGFKTSLKAGFFTPAQFLTSSFILVKNVGFSELLMLLLLDKRL